MPQPHPTIHDVAKRAGVALSTASDILNGKLKATARTAERVRRAARELGYRPNLLGRRLRTARAEAFGLVAPYRRPLFSSALLADLLSGIQAQQQQAGLNLVLASKRYDGPGEIYGADLFESRAVDGLIVVGTRESYGRDAGRDVRALRGLGCPLVWLHVYESREAVDRVILAGDGLQAALEHLRARGHRRVGWIEQGVGRTPGALPDPAPLQRRLEPLGMTTRAAWLGEGEAHDGAAFRAALDILRRPAGERPSALLCSGDDLGLAALQAALGLGLRVPGEVAIISTRNYSIGGNAAVPLTTFGAPMSALGQAAVRRLVELIAEPGQAPRTVEIPGGLIVRAST